jgi:flagellar biosynthesis protein FlhB
MAEQETDSGEKEFEASEQKQRQAREEGNVVQSKEVNAFALVIGLLITAGLWATFTGKALFEILSGVFYHADTLSADMLTPGSGRLERTLIDIILAAVPALLILTAATIAALVVTRGIAFSTKKIKPDIQKLSITSNLKKKYGPQGLLEFVKDTAKLVIAGLIAGFFLFQFAVDYYAGSTIRQGDFAAFTFEHTLKLIFAFAIFQFLLAAIDFPLQRLLHARRLRMTREEMKKENKQNEGDPHFKSARRSKAAKISSGKMLQAVKTATVVMVNPEHYAVALVWDPDSRKAPVCVAKGVDHLAARIREVALANKVPIYRDPPSTRSIYKLVDIDEEIRPEHFAAVAAAIQFVERVRQTARSQ